MEKYNRNYPFQTFPVPKELPKSTSTQPKQGGKLLACFAGGIGLLSVMAIPAWIDFSSPRIISILADDISSSAKNPAYEKLRHEHCLSLKEQYKAGDEVVRYYFADRPEINRELTINNQLDALSMCQETTPKDLEIGKRDGTSLILLLEQIQTKVKSLRTQGDKKPVVVTITIQDTEPGNDQPKVDFSRIQKLTNAIAQDRGVVVIVGPKGKLQNDLETFLKGDRVRVFPLQSIQAAVDWGMKTGRSL